MLSRDVGILHLPDDFLCDLCKSCKLSETASPGTTRLHCFDVSLSQTRVAHWQCVHNVVFHSIVHQKR